MATNDKYDRQLRLWGASGQRALGETTVVLIRATAAGTETLKNLVLPGVGHIFILDDGQVGETFTSNFFLDDKGNARAQTALEHLMELNPDVQGTFQQVEDLSVFDFAPILNKEHTIVVASDLEPPILLNIAKHCQSSNIPLVSVSNYGLMGTVRLQTPVLSILNPKPRDGVPDLRLVRPFHKLLQLADSIDMGNLENHEHSHVPYPILLLQASKEWKQTHDNTLPKTFGQKQEFQAFVKSRSRNYDNELNFQEAVQYSYLAYSEKDLDHLPALKESATGDLQVLLSALSLYLKQYGQPPVIAKIPDMTSSTDLYIDLQNVYKQQADTDKANFKTILSSLDSMQTISDETTDLFLVNLYDLDVLSTCSIASEWSKGPDAESLDELNMSLMEGEDRPDQIPLLWYLGLRGCGLFFERNGRYPGTVADYAADVGKLQDCIATVVHLYQLSSNEIIQQHLIKSTSIAQELTRYGNAEIHNVASIVGGVASQEVVKIITGQYVPLNHTYIYNGISSVGAVYKI